MFEFLRKGATSVFAKLFLAIIVIVFIFWGIGDFITTRKNLVAKVEGRSIELDEFQQYYNFQLSKLRQTFGELSEEDIKRLNLKREVLNQLIRMKLLEKYAKEMGIKVTKDEISMTIAQIPAFTQRGFFDQQAYHSVLRELGLTPKFFEYLIYQDLLQQKLRLVLTVPVTVSEEEVREYFRYLKQELNLWEGSIPLDYCKAKVNYVEKDLENFYLAHKDIYKEEEKVKIKYYLISYDQDVIISLEEAKRFYEANIGRFRTPFKVKAKIMFISETEGLEKAQKIKDQLKTLNDFDRYENTETAWFEEASIPSEIASVLKQAREGQILGPFKTSRGYLIVGVERLQQEGVLPFEKVKEEIIKYLKNEKIKSKTQEKANRIYTEVLRENSLLIWAEKNRINLSETSWLSKKEFIGLFKNVQMARTVFEKTKGEFFAPFETEKGFVILTLFDKRPARPLSFEEAKPKVLENFLNEKGKSLCEEKVKDFINRVKTKTNLTNEDFIQEGFYLKTYIVPREKIGELFNPAISTQIMNVGRPKLIDFFFWERDNVKVLYVKEIKPYKKEVRDSEVLKYYHKSLSEKRDRWISHFYTELEKKAKIKIYPLFDKL